MGLLLVGACLIVKSKLISSLLKLYANSCPIELVSSIQRKNFPGGGGAGQGVNSSGRDGVTVKLGAVLKIFGAGAILDA